MSRLTQRMKVIFFDTETTGVAINSKVSALTGPNNWPDIVSIAWWVFEDRTLVKREYHLIKPAGWTVSAEVSRIHGITHAVAEANGKPLTEVIHLFNTDLQGAIHVIAHNMYFDKNVVFNAIKWRLGLDPLSVWPAKGEFCSMEQSKGELRIPSKFGRPSDPWKWPRLDELYEDTFGKRAPQNAHNAERDVDVLQQIVWKRWSLLESNGGVAELRRKDG